MAGRQPRRLGGREAAEASRRQGGDKQAPPATSSVKPSASLDGKSRSSSDLRVETCGYAVTVDSILQTRAVD